MNDNDEARQLARANLHGETARIDWCELQRFFAGGLTLVVARELDIVEVALQMSLDNKTAVAQWMDGGQLAKVSDDQARQWLADDARVWSVVIKPWVLVQEE